MIADSAAKTIKLAPEISSSLHDDPVCRRMRRGAFTWLAKKVSHHADDQMCAIVREWCGRRESNPHLLSGAQELCR
jgi:hypothetical protein